MAMTIQFKRGTSSRWAELDPILAEGEPGYDLDKGKLKIGNGVDPWSKLPFQDEHAVVSKRTIYEFPSYGKTNTIYKEESTGKLYQWVVSKDNPSDSGSYSLLGTGGTVDATNIIKINGGNAYGTT